MLVEENLESRRTSRAQKDAEKYVVLVLSSDIYGKETVLIFTSEWSIPPAVLYGVEVGLHYFWWITVVNVSPFSGKPFRIMSSDLCLVEF